MDIKVNYESRYRGGLRAPYIQYIDMSLLLGRDPYTWRVVIYGSGYRGWLRAPMYARGVRVPADGELEPLTGTE